MGKEIERKFLLRGDEWREGAEGVRTRQGYLATVAECTVRVRVMGEKAYITVKGKTEGVSRSEFEYGIPREDAEEMLAHLCQQPLIEKTRYKVEYAGLEWEVDEFAGANEGLLLAEVELESEDQKIELPPWVGQEVSDDHRYFNVNLLRHPFSEWGKKTENH